MTRREDWYPRLFAYIAWAEQQSFCPGRFDCALFAAGAVEAMTGIDLAAHWRGRYRSLRGGARVLRAEGYSDHLTLATAHLDAIAPALAAIGDLAVIRSQADSALGVVLGPTAAVLRPGKGLDRVSIGILQGAFRV